jgi:hypothetical protein
MINDENIIREISNSLKVASKKCIDRIIADYSEDIFGKKDDLDGHETDITPTIRNEINNHLLNEVKNILNEREIDGIVFKVKTYKVKEEKLVGADILGILNIEFNGGETTKYFLAQSKIAKTKRGGHYSCNNQDIIRQAGDMLKITSDSFFFLYTSIGIKVVSAMAVALRNRNSITTKYTRPKEFEDFYQDFFDCFIGDNRMPILKILNEPVHFETDLNVLFININIPTIKSN